MSSDALRYNATVYYYKALTVMIRDLCMFVNHLNFVIFLAFNSEYRNAVLRFACARGPVRVGAVASTSALVKTWSQSTQLKAGRNFLTKMRISQCQEWSASFVGKGLSGGHCDMINVIVDGAPYHMCSCWPVSAFYVLPSMQCLCLVHHRPQYIYYIVLFK